MIEADVWKILIPVLKNGLTDRGIDGITIKQSYQPTKQGIDSSGSVYLHKIMSHRIGHQGRKYSYNQGAEDFDIVEKNWRAMTIQLSAVIKQNIYDEDSITAYDVVDMCSMILQSISVIKQFVAQKIGIEVIKTINMPYFIDDKDQFSLDPSFDFVLTYEQTMTSKIPKIDIFDVDIKRI